jgi:glycosyltransferase involved in cell wall biosynthesis
VDRPEAPQERNFSSLVTLSEQMQRKPRLLVAVPAYNEAGSVAAVVEAIHAHVSGADVMVIDDGSTDATAARAREAGAYVVRLPYNLGIGGAVQTGFVFACEQGYDYMVQVDGDGQHDPAEIHKLLETLATEPGLDMAYGSRFLTGEHGYRAPLGRRIGIRMFAFALSRAVGQPVTDPTSGFRLCNRRAIELFAREYPQDYPEVEALMMMHENRLRFAEVAVRMHLRADGRSSITPRRSAYYMIKVSLALLAGVLRRRTELTPTIHPHAT